MTISAQVIDTIVEWIDDNLHQPLRIDDIARHAGYSKWHLQRLFLQYKGESWGAIFAKGSCWPPAICVTPISGSTISAWKYGFDSQQTFTRVFTRTFNLPPGAYRKREPQSRPLRRALPGLAFERNQRRHTQRSTRYSQWRPVLRTTNKTTSYKAG